MVVQSVYGLSLRAAHGFASSLMNLMQLDLLVPNYSTVYRRQGSITVPICASSSRLRHIVIDATGLRVYGAGEWHVHKHPGVRRRSWRKLYVGVDEHTKEIVAVEITASHVHDSRMLPSLLTQISGKVGQVSGERAYDTRAWYASIGRRGAKATIPPRRNAKRMRCDHAQDTLAIRDAHLRQIQQHGRYAWRVASGCTRQSLAENARLRFTRMFGSQFRARRFENQRVEGWIKCLVLNRMGSLGMPESQRMQ